MIRRRASIDLGTHTARLLVADVACSDGQSLSVARKREYIRLSDGFDPVQGTLHPKACTRAIDTMKRFSDLLHGLGVEDTHAVATGILRSAENRGSLFQDIEERTGIRLRLLRGEEEARLTAKGVLSALKIPREDSVIFDLGGGSTEFIWNHAQGTEVKSLPLGALVLTQQYVLHDPPDHSDMEALSGYVEGVLRDAGVHQRPNPLVVGTGGTVTTLGAMIHGVPVEEIQPGAMNGLILKREEIRDLFQRMSAMPQRDRSALPGLDLERAGVICAGTLVVLKVLDFLGVMEFRVSLSDLLEGVLIESLGG